MAEANGGAPAPKAAAPAPAVGPAAPDGGVGNAGGPAPAIVAPAAAVGPGGIPAIIPPVAPPVAAGAAGPGPAPPPAAAPAGPPPAASPTPAGIGAAIPRSNCPINPNQYDCLISFAKFRRLCRWHFMLLTLNCFSSPNAESVIDRVGIHTFRSYIVALCIRFRHALASSLLNNINKARNLDYRALPQSVKQHLNMYTDVLIDSIGARIIALLKTVYLNITIEPAIFDFLLPHSAATFLITEQFQDDGGVGPPALEHGWRLAFSFSAANPIAGALNGMNTDSSPLLDFWNIGAAYGFPAPPGGVPVPGMYPALAARAQAVFSKENIITFEKPLIKASASTSIAPFLRAYIRSGTLDNPMYVAIRGIIDSDNVSNQTLCDRMFLPLRIGVPAGAGDDHCFPFIRDPGWAPFVLPTDSSLGHTYTENTRFPDILTYLGIMR